MGAQVVRVFEPTTKSVRNLLDINPTINYKFFSKQISEISEPVYKQIDGFQGDDAGKREWALRLLGEDAIIARYRGFGDEKESEYVYWVFVIGMAPKASPYKVTGGEDPVDLEVSGGEDGETQYDLGDMDPMKPYLDTWNDKQLASLILFALAYIQMQAFEKATPRIVDSGLLVFRSGSNDYESVKDPHLDAALENSQVLWWEVGSPDPSLQNLYTAAQQQFNSRMWRDQVLSEIQLLRSGQERIRSGQERRRDLAEREEARTLNSILFALTLVTIITGMAGIAVAILLTNSDLLFIAWGIFILTPLASLLTFRFSAPIFRWMRRWTGSDE